MSTCKLTAQANQLPWYGPLNNMPTNYDWNYNNTSGNPFYLYPGEYEYSLECNALPGGDPGQINYTFKLYLQ